MDGQIKRFNRNLDVVTTFQDLPNDLVRKILQHLSLAERFQLRGICKAWKRLVLEGLVSIDIRKTECFQKSRATVDSLNGLIARNQCTLCSLTIHLDHCDCYRGYGCKCQLPRISLLPSSLHIHQLSRLEALDFGTHNFALNSAILQRLTALVKLESLVCLFEPSYVELQEGLEYSRVAQLADFSTLPKLRRLSLQIWEPYWMDSQGFRVHLKLPAQAHGLPHLTHLHIGHSDTLLVTQPFYDIVSRLTQLSVTGCSLTQLQNGRVRPELGTHRKLDGLNLTCLSMSLHVNATQLPYSLSHKLRKLELDLIDGNFQDLPEIADLLQICAGLESLILTCMAVSGDGYLDPFVSMTSLEVLHLLDLREEDESDSRRVLSAGLSMDKLLDLKLLYYEPDLLCNSLHFGDVFEQFPALERLSLVDCLPACNCYSLTLKSVALSGWRLISDNTSFHLSMDLEQLPNLESLSLSTADRYVVNHVFGQVVRMPRLKLLEITYFDYGGCRLVGLHSGRARKTFEVQSHLDFLDQTVTAMYKWQRRMHWDVVEKMQASEAGYACSFVRLNRSSSAGFRGLGSTDAYSYERRFEHARINITDLQSAADRGTGLAQQWLDSWSQMPPLERYGGKYELAELLEKDGLGPSDLQLLDDGRAYIDELLGKHGVEAPVAVRSCLRRTFGTFGCAA